MSEKKRKVFISYAHSSPEHKKRVADLAAVFRNHGLEVLIDSNEKTPQGPPIGWPRWMKQQLKDAHWVVIFFDELYRKRYDGDEDPGQGLGATWEGAIITNELYRESVINTRFIPVLADKSKVALIPDELFGANRYYIPSQSEQLAKAILDAPDGGERGGGEEGGKGGSSKPAPGSAPRISPPRLRHAAEHLFGRDAYLEKLDAAWEKHDAHIVTIVAWGGVGKTSLVVEWMAGKSSTNWAGFAQVFDWSFYSQGTRDSGEASSGAFVEAALTFFGDAAMAKSAKSASDKGARLAELAAASGTLLVLDGLEPLQYPPGPLEGRLKDPAIEALLKGLARYSRGLCVVTTRERVTDLDSQLDHGTVSEWRLENLDEEAGAALLHRAGATRAGAVAIEADDEELKAASREVQGHALTLRLIGGYLRVNAGGDIRTRDTVPFEAADLGFKTNTKAEAEAYGHAFKAISMYETWLAANGEDGRRQLAVLRMLGLFDRPAKDDCLSALRKAPPIPGLTEPVVGLGGGEWNAALTRLSDCTLVSRQQSPPAVDAHPLVRAYFAMRMKEKKSARAWRAGHARLFKYLRDSTKDKPQATLDDLQPLHQAVAHGCQAGLCEEARAGVYWDRILRGKEFYSLDKLGAFGANLGVVACFFKTPWSEFLPGLGEPAQAWLLGQAAISLRALGRLGEAVEPMRAGLDMRKRQEDWCNAARSANNLSELELTLGRTSAAVRDAEQSIDYADRSKIESERMISRTAFADTLHQAGRKDEALERFREAEAMQARFQPEYPLLYSLWGSRYCDLLLADAERAAWRGQLGWALPGTDGDRGGSRTPARNLEEALKRYDEVEARAARTLEWMENYPGSSLHSLSLDHLTLGRAALYRAVLTDSKSGQAQAIDAARGQLMQAVDGLRAASQQDHIPRSLLSRAWLRFFDGDAVHARVDLDEAWEIASRGSMQLFLADILLYRARLFRAETPYPWDAPKADLDAAAALIGQCGYHRRDAELEDAREVIR